ncbi:opsin-5-like protein [Lates japonicus]|uniref:Opsin-5-like protein n=1 Tax=Lates japonicus TaxID=270547 RepID=A0AAD3N2Z0_LATJO|nr:opsin-5-like protein [Lates japonicus]
MHQHSQSTQHSPGPRTSRSPSPRASLCRDERAERSPANTNRPLPPLTESLASQTVTPGDQREQRPDPTARRRPDRSSHSACRASRSSGTSDGEITKAQTYHPAGEADGDDHVTSSDVQSTAGGKRNMFTYRPLHAAPHPQPELVAEGSHITVAEQAAETDAAEEADHGQADGQQPGTELSPAVTDSEPSPMPRTESRNHGGDQMHESRVNDFLLSVLGNGLVLVICYRRRKKMVGSELLCVNLAVVDFLCCICFYPLSILSSFHHVWLGENITCLSTIGHVPEPYGLSCTIAWRGYHTSAKDAFHVICSFACFTLVPVLFIVVSQCRILYKVSRFSYSLSARGIRNNLRHAEKRLSVMFFCISFGFVIAWAPYAVVSFLFIFHKEPQYMAPEGFVFPALFAKSSHIYNPFIYFYFNKTFQRELRCMLVSLWPKLEGNRVGVHISAGHQIPYPIHIQLQERDRICKSRGKVTHTSGKSVHGRQVYTCWGSTSKNTPTGLGNKPAKNSLPVSI